VIETSPGKSIIGDAWQGRNASVSVSSGASVSEQSVLGNEPSVLAVFNVLRDLARHANAKSSVRGVDSFMDIRPQEGFIYLLESDFGFKIGRTKKVSNRLTQFGVLLPFEVTLVHTFYTINMFERERQLHERFRSQRIRGEWFTLTYQDIQLIKCLADEWDG
jgi:hypothetical protein